MYDSESPEAIQRAYEEFLRMTEETERIVNTYLDKKCIAAINQADISLTIMMALEGDA